MCLKVTLFQITINVPLQIGTCTPWLGTSVLEQPQLVEQ